MIDETNQTPDGKTSIGDAGSREIVSTEARRRLIKGGLSAAPVILTLTSRPVLGFDQMCLSPSRMVSGNHSGFAGPITSGGSNRSYWQAQALLNPQPGWAKVKFADVFGTTNDYVTSGIGNPKNLGPVLVDSMAGNDANSNSVSGFASYIIAAYMNVSQSIGSVSTVLTTAQVVHMWNDVIETGRYYPQGTAQATMSWDANGVIGYLVNSGIVPAA